MGTSTAFPNGQTLVSSALTATGISSAIAAIITQVLGVLPDAPNADSAVRIDWPTGGAPAYAITDDVVFVRCVQVDDPYNRQREKSGAYNDGVTVAETWSYTRAWQVSFTVVGPNSTDNARLIFSGLFLDYVNDALAAVNLFPIPDFTAPTRAPELFDGQWWERVEMEFRAYEAVTETIQTAAIYSADVIFQDEFGNSATVHNQPQGFGVGPFGSGNYGL